jgi:NodT family efflux transporter outer membrane factor (OMF) lipoprotein
MKRALLLAPLILAGCAVGPDYKEPVLPAPKSYAVESDKAPQVELARWWSALGDPQLDALVEEAIKANPDVAIALDRLQQVRAAEAILIGLELPRGEASGGLGKGTGSDTTRARATSLLDSADNTALSPTKQIRQTGGFDAVWEIDLFGQYRRAIEAGLADVDAAMEARNAVLVNVISDVVRAYVDLRGLQVRYAVLTKNIEVATASRDFVKLRFDQGITNELDYTLAERELAALQSQVAPLAAQRDAAEFLIATLVGRYPEDMAAELKTVHPIPALPAAIEPGLPLDLVKRRPDVRQSERALAAATARIGVATGNLFPHVAIAGTEGVQFTSIGMEHGTHMWSFGPGAYWPLLDFGTLDALVEIADLKAHEQLVTYKKSLLDAVRDVDGSVAAYSAQQDSVKDLAEAVMRGQRAVELANERYARGLTDYLNVVDAERQQYALEGELVFAQQLAGEDFVAVFKSLGGGWENYQQIPPIRLPHPAILAMFERLVEPSHVTEDVP